MDLGRGVAGSSVGGWVGKVVAASRAYISATASSGERRATRRPPSARRAWAPRACPRGIGAIRLVE
jgi:hypothetical protein